MALATLCRRLTTEPCLVCRVSPKENYKRKRQTERLVNRFKRTERDVARREKALDQVRADLSALRRAHGLQTNEHAHRLAEA